jgi:phosphoribosylaminoimidazolecarboxamide formyltransferase/IMP cyclohydrolase
MIKIRRALFSVSDKSGIVDLARALRERFGVECLSTGGTASLLRETGVECTEVASYTGFPEMMAGRVKTLHPKIHGGILGRRGEDDAAMAAAGIAPIDLVVVNLYPFRKTIARPDCTREMAVEHIDVGGPAMIRAAAKNHRFVAVVVDPADYPALLAEISGSDGALSEASAAALAVKAFEHTAAYDAAICNYLSANTAGGGHIPFPRHFTVQWDKRQDLRYGENPHQRAAFYVEHNPPSGTIATAEQLQGAELSFNNIADADAAIECVASMGGPACCIVKHANPCGVACRSTLEKAYIRAYEVDPTSAFGGIVAFNQMLDEATARAILERQFAEVIVAPLVSEAAQEVLRHKSQIRVLQVGLFNDVAQPALDFRRVNGGILIQDKDLGQDPDGATLRVVTRRRPAERELKDMFFAWNVCRMVKSNAIVYAKDMATLGIGAGQMSRVVSARIAAMKGDENEHVDLDGAVMASDAFMPFRDTLDIAGAEGITAVIQPGGSKRDDEVIAAANERDMAMVFTGMRHFRH